MEDNIEILLEFIRISTHREKVFKTLNKESKKPSDIARETGLHINNVSHSLKQLKERELVYLLNPEDKKGRLYKLTDLGEIVIKELINKEKSEK